MPTPEFDNTPQVVFVSCPATSTLKAAHGPVFYSDRCTNKTTDMAVFALPPLTTVSISELMPQCTATTNHAATTSHSDSVPMIPNCVFASTETSPAPAQTDGIVPGPIYTSGHPTRSVSVLAIPSCAFAAANAEGIVSTIVRTSIYATATAPSLVVVPATVNCMSAATSPLVVAIAHLALALAPATAPL